MFFVSRENAGRSILAQACLTYLRKGRFKALSREVPGQTDMRVPHAVFEVLTDCAIPSKGLHNKSWNDFMRSGAPRLNFVISLEAATVSLHPSWPGQPDAALWSCAPVWKENNKLDDLKPLVLQTLYSLRRRLELLVALPMHGLDRSALRSDIRDLAHMT